MPFPDIMPDIGQKRTEGPVSRRVKNYIRRHFGLDEGASVFVAEIVCGETDCPDVETVVAVFLEDGRREFKLHKPVREITRHDIGKLKATPVESKDSNSENGE